MARSAVLTRSMSAGLARARRRNPGHSAVPLDIVCFCQGIERHTILEAIVAGADTVDKIQEMIGATTGPCGGSCTPCVQAILDQSQGREATGTSCSPGPCRGDTCSGDRQPAGSTESGEDSSQSDPRRRR